MTVLTVLAVIVGVLRPIPLMIHSLCKGIEIDPYFFMDNKHYQQSYQAVSHILVGTLGSLWYYGEPGAKEVLIALSVIEVICAILTIRSNHGQKTAT